MLRLPRYQNIPSVIRCLYLKIPIRCFLFCFILFLFSAYRRVYKEFKIISILKEKGFFWDKLIKYFSSFVLFIMQTFLWGFFYHLFFSKSFHVLLFLVLLCFYVTFVFLFSSHLFSSSFFFLYSSFCKIIYFLDFCLVSPFPSFAINRFLFLFASHLFFFHTLFSMSCIYFHGFNTCFKHC